MQSLKTIPEEGTAQTIGLFQNKDMFTKKGLKKQTKTNVKLKKREERTYPLQSPKTDYKPNYKKVQGPSFLLSYL